MLGIEAEATLLTATPSEPNSWVRSTLGSLGLWGIESDSHESHLRSIAYEELDVIEDALKVLGINAEEIVRHLESAKDELTCPRNPAALRCRSSHLP